MSMRRLWFFVCEHSVPQARRHDLSVVHVLPEDESYYLLFSYAHLYTVHELLVTR